MDNIINTLDINIKKDIVSVTPIKNKCVAWDGGQYGSRQTITATVDIGKKYLVCSNKNVSGANVIYGTLQCGLLEATSTSISCTSLNYGVSGIFLSVVEVEIG